MGAYRRQVDDRRERRRERDRAVARVLFGVLIVNLAVAAGKLLVGWRVGAVALFADGLHSLLDGSSNVVGLVGIAAATRPPDREHPYGHRRFETLAAAAIGLLIAGGLVAILAGAWRSLTGEGPAVRPTPLAAAFVALTIAVNTIVSRFEARRGAALRSSLLMADSGHTASDALASVVVLISFGGAAVGLVWMDAVAAGVVALLVGRTAFRIIAHNLGVLVDRALLDPGRVRDVVLAVEGVRGVRRIRSRGPGDCIQVDLCVQLDPQLTLAQAHEKTHQVARAIERSLPEVADVVIHTEPAGESGEDGVLP